MRILLVFMCLLTVFVAEAGNEYHLAGARGWAMGNASVTFTDIFALNSNQAGLAGMDNISVGVYSERKFLLSTVNTHAFALALPVKMGVFGLSVNYFGFNNYNDKKIGLAFAKLLSEHFSIGAQLDYLSTVITEYGNKSVVTFELGILSKLNKELSLGAHIYNPVRANMGIYQNEKTPSVIKAGLSYQPSDKLLLAVEVEKDIDLKPVFKAGVEYQLVDILFIRAGIATNPTYNTFGLGLDLKRFKIDFASSIHTILGYTPHLSLTYEFDNQQEKN